jgi:hypothetical protein
MDSTSDTPIDALEHESGRQLCSLRDLATGPLVELGQIRFRDIIEGVTVHDPRQS